MLLGMLLLPLFLLSAFLVLVVLCACRVGHHEDVRRGFTEDGR